MTTTKLKLTYWKIIRVASMFLGVMAFLLVVLYAVFLIPAVQAFAAGYVTDWMSEKSGTVVLVEKVRLRPVKRFTFGDIFIQDYNGDTLLYAREMKARLDGFDPFRKSARVSGVRLVEPVFTMRRPMGDSIFTFDRFAAAFRNADMEINTEKPKKKSAWQLALGGLDLREARFRFEDDNAKTFFTIDIKRFLVDVKKADVINQVFAAKSAVINGLDFEFEKRNEQRGPLWSPPIDTPHLNTSSWKFFADEFRIENSKFTFDDWRKPELGGLDFTHLDVEDINISFTDLHMIGDTIEATIDKIAAREQSGLELSSLSGTLVLNNRELEITDMLLQTPHSYLEDYLKMEYGTFHSFEDFIPNMYMDGKFRNSFISMKDLELFTPDLAEVKGDIGLSGHIYGTVENLKGRDVALSFGRKSKFAGRFGIDGLPDAKESFIEFRMDEMVSNYQDLTGLLPGQQLPDVLNKLGQFKLTGEFIGFPNDFVAFGTLSSDLGQVESDLNLKVNQQTNRVRYSGKLNADNFQIGSWLDKQDLLGHITFSATVEGTGNARGIALNNMDAHVDANVNNFLFKGYEYSDLSFDGDFKEGFFDGSLESADPNFDQTFEGEIDFNGKRPVFDFESDIRSLDLYALNLVPQPLSLQGLLEINLEGDKVDSILGTAGFRNLVVKGAGQTHQLDSLLVNAFESNGLRTLQVESDPFSAHFDGNFALTEMPDAIKTLVDHYFPESGLKYDTLIADQDLNFTLNIRDSKSLTALFLPAVKQIKNSHVRGSFNSTRNEFDLRAVFPEVEAGGVDFTELRIDMQTNQDEIVLFSKSEQIGLTDTIRTPVTVLEGEYRSDSLFFQLLMGKDSDIDRINLNGAITAVDGAFHFSILPSEIVTRNDQWDISPNNSLTYDYKKFRAKDFTITSGEQSIALTSTEKRGFDSWIDIKLSNVQIGKLMTSFQVNPADISGDLNGTISITNLFNTPAYSAIVKVKQFSVDNLPLGTLTTTASLVQPQDQLRFIGALQGENSVRIQGNLGLKDKDAPIEAELEIDHLVAWPFGRYLSDIFDEVEGVLSGNMKLSGTVKNPRFSGQAMLSNGQLRLMYTNVRYRIPEVNVNVIGNRLVFNPALVYDHEDNSGLLTGALLPNTLSDWDFQNLRVETENMIFMETSRLTNPEFYGTAYGSGNVVIDGSLSDIDITISAKSNRGTKIFIPITYGPSLSGSDFIHFVDYSENSTGQIAQSSRTFSRVNFRFYLDVNELAEVEIDIGDKLRGTGRGSLQLDINNRGDFTMSGVYTVSSGSYAFSLQDIFTKDFKIDPGSRITWNGDPYQAQLNVSAVYATRASEWDLVSEFESSMSAEEIRDARQPKNVDVYLNLTGPLESPNVDFDIQVRQGQSGGTSFFDRKLTQIKADKNELSKQVFGLLVMSRFIPDESGINPLISSASNSVSEFLSRQLSVYVSDWISQFIFDLDVDIKYYSYTGIENALNQQELQVDLSKNFLDNRVFVNVGGNFGVGDNTTTGEIGNDNVVGDFEIEYAITPDGRIRVKAFQRTDYDVLLGRNVGETGVGIFYSQEFDSLYDLAADRRRRKALREASKEEAEQPEKPAEINGGDKDGASSGSLKR